MNRGQRAREALMNCFECAKANDTVPAVGICHHCGVGLCPDHLAEAREFRVGGTLYGCGHVVPRSTPLRGVSAGLAAQHSHSTSA